MQVPGLVRGPVERCLSRLCDDAEIPSSSPSCSGSAQIELDACDGLGASRGLRDLVFSCVGLGVTSTAREVRQLVACSLMAIQAAQADVDLIAKVSSPTLPNRTRVGLILGMRAKMRSGIDVMSLVLVF